MGWTRGERELPVVGLIQGLVVMALAGLPTLLAAQQRPVPFAPGMVITASTRIAPGSYRIPDGDSVGIVMYRSSHNVVALIPRASRDEG